VGLGRKMLPTDWHGLARIGTDYWGECSGLFFLAIEPSSYLAIRQKEEERGSRIVGDVVKAPMKTGKE